MPFVCFCYTQVPKIIVGDSPSTDDKFVQFLDRTGQRKAPVPLRSKVRSLLIV
jgi:hypothetical protein